MFLFYSLLCVTIISVATTQDTVIMSNMLESINTPIKVIEADLMLTKDKIIVHDDKVKVQLYYECLCPDCREFDTQAFLNAVKELHQYLDIHTYPYGNAKTITNGDGTVEFECQHGPAECYGNKLHACALDAIRDQMKALEFNSCMMDPNRIDRGSNDRAAEECGNSMKIDAKPIKNCASGEKGNQLLKYYGEESHKINFNYVPYVLINGKEWDTDKGGDFMAALCSTFPSPPPPCAKEI